MSYGLQVNNAGNVTQIDPNYSNFEIISSGYSAGTTISNNLVDFGGDGTYLFFCRPRTNGNHIGRGRITAAHDVKSTFVYERGGDGYWRWDSYVPAVNWQGMDYIVARPSFHQNAVSSGYGLQVFDAQGRTVFDSNRTYLKIVGVYRANVSTSIQTFSLPTPKPGKKYYVCSLPLYFYEVHRSEYGDEDYYGFTFGFTTDTSLKVRANQCVYVWAGVVDTSPRNWHIGNDHNPYFLVAEY